MRRAATALLALPFLAGCGGAPPPAAHPSATPTIPLVTDMAGEVVVTDPDAIQYAGGGHRCVTRAPYDDIRAGVLVSIRSATGVIKAITALQPGYVRQLGTDRKPAGCVFTFSYSQAAAGAPSFRVRVAHRPVVTVSYRDLLAIEVVLPRP